MKKMILPVLALAAFASTAVRAEEPVAQRFEHGGRIYSYTVTRAGDTRVISGVEEKTGKPFTLRVGAHRVRGTVGTQQVSFSIREVEPLGKSVTTLAAR